MGPHRVAMFHRVDHAIDPAIGPQTSVTPDSFERFIARAKKQVDLVSLDDLVAATNRRKASSEKLMAITFDDGFLDNLSLASEVLRVWNVPWTLYVCSGLVDRSIVPFEYFISNYCGADCNLPSEVLAKTFGESASDPTDLKESQFKQLKSHLKHATLEVRQQLLARLRDDYPGISRQHPPVLSVKHIREMAADPNVTIGGHSRNHLLLTSQSVDVLHRELSIDRDLLSQWTGSAVTHFAYPYGGHNEQVVAAVEAAGYGTAVTTIPQEIRSRRLHYFRIPRIEISSDAIDQWFSDE